MGRDCINGLTGVRRAGRTKVAGRGEEQGRTQRKFLTKRTGQDSRMALRWRERTGCKKVTNPEGRAAKLLITGGQDRTQKIF